MKLHWIFDRFMKPDDDGAGSGGGAAADRGDDFTPTGGDAVDPPADAAGAAADVDPPAGEDDPDPEVAAAAALAAGAKAKAKDTRIPLARHESVLAKQRERVEALEAENAKLRETRATATASAEIDTAQAALDAKEATYDSLVEDGKVVEARALRAEIRAGERALTEQRMQLHSQASQARAVETVRYDMTADRIEAAYPMLDRKHADFDAGKSAEVVELMTAFQRNGNAPSAALQKAVKYVMGEGITGAQKTATEVVARVDKDGADVAAAAKAAAVAKNLATAGKQPPSAARVGMDSDKAGGALSAKHVVGMSQKDFAKLDDATLAKMRGDVIA